MPVWDLIEWLADPVIDLFVHVYRADTRPDARRFTVGCLLFLVALVALVTAFYFFD